MKKKDIQANYHPDPRNNTEQFFFKRIPAVLKAYGLGDIKFNFLSPTQEHLECGDTPEETLLMVRYDPIYRSAFLVVTPHAIQLYKHGEYKTLSDGLVHEVGHLITNRLEKLARNRHTTQKDIDEAVEETTETIAQIAVKLLSKTDPMFK